MSSDALHRVATLRESGETARAIEQGEREIVRHPALADALHLVGVLHCEASACGRGLRLLELASRLEPHNPQIWLNVARGQRRLSSYPAAVTALARALVLAPGQSFTINVAGAYKASREFDSAAKFFSNKVCVWAASLDPLSLDAVLHLATLVKRQGDYEGAVAWYLKAVTLSPAALSVLTGLAEAWTELGYFDEAQRMYGWAWVCEPGSQDVPYWLSFVQLRACSFEAGWLNYEYRWSAAAGAAQQRECAEVRASRPQFSGESPGKRVLLWAEQGIGDEIMFGGMIKEFSQYCRELIVQLDPRLVELFSRAIPGVEFIGFEQPLPLDRYDEQLSLGSLGRYLRPNRESFVGKGTRYLHGRPGLSARLRKDLNLQSNEFLVGLSWQSANPEFGPSRSLSLADLLRSLSLGGVRFLNLQYGDSAPEIEDARRQVGTALLAHPEVNLTRDLNGVAGLIECCDLVVSVGNATAHLAGALGRATWVLLPYVAGWRWLQEGEACLWYESVRLFRQQRRGDWGSVMLDVRSAFQRRLNYGVGG